MYEKPHNPFLKQGPKLEDMEQMQCSACGNVIFDQYYRMYKLSALNSPSGKSQVFHVPVFACAGCGELIDVKKIESSAEEIIDNSRTNQDTK